MSSRPAKACSGKAGVSKGKKPPSVGKKTEDVREETLQAVLLADSFETRFNPLTLETPRCLLPLANIPLIEYTLEFLAMSGVAEIHIYCGAHTSAVENYIQSSKWHPTCPVSPFQVLEIVKTTARSVGDVMRDLDSRDLIIGDFLLVHGDLISNLPIDTALAKHRARRMADKNSIMTIILRAGGLGTHRTKSKGVTPVFIIDPTNNRCLHYEDMHQLQANKYLNIDPDLLTTHTEMEIRMDLIDCGIDICTPDVLALWAESFDYEVPRSHFLHGVLKDYELNGKTIYTEIVDDHYAARVSNLQSYESVSKDVLGRWTYPFVPDSNLVAGQTYRFERGGLCKENGVILARTCKARKRTVLGQDTSIGDGSIVSDSIIGRRCQIGKNVTIKDAFIWDHVVVGDGSTVERAIVANESVIGKNCNIQPGSVLSFGVRIADHCEVKAGQRVLRPKRALDDVSEDPPTLLTDPAIVGEGGEGYLFQEDHDSDDEGATFHSSLIYNVSHLNLSTDSISTITSTVSQGTPTSGSRHPSFVGSINSDSEVIANDNFHHDAVNGLLDTLKENGDFDSAKLEFMGLRLSNDANDHQIRRAIAVAFTKRIAQIIENEHLEALKAATQAFNTPGAEKFLKEVAIGSAKRTADQVHFLSCMQKDLVHRNHGATILAAISQSLYTREVLDEDAFLAWWHACELLGDSEPDALNNVRKKTAVFINWLKDADEETSADEDEGQHDDHESD